MPATPRPRASRSGLSKSCHCLRAGARTRANAIKAMRSWSFLVFEAGCSDAQLCARSAAHLWAQPREKERPGSQRTPFFGACVPSPPSRQPPTPAGHKRSAFGADRTGRGNSLLPIPVIGSIARGTQRLNCSTHAPWIWNQLPELVEDYNSCDEAGEGRERPAALL